MNECMNNYKFISNIKQKGNIAFTIVGNGINPIEINLKNTIATIFSQKTKRQCSFKNLV